MSSEESQPAVSQNHPSEPPEFEFDEGETLQLNEHHQPTDYLIIKARVWNYDAETENALTQLRAFKQYVVGDVSTMGGNERLMTEDDLLDHYRRVDREEAMEVL